MGLCAAIINGDLEDSDLVLQRTDTGYNFLQRFGPPNNNLTIGTAVTERQNVASLLNNRFKASVDWRDFAGNSGPGVVEGVSGQTIVDAGPDGPMAEQSGLFYFVDPENWELLVKVLDGCITNDNSWVFFAATTNVEFTVTVTDTQTNASRQYLNPLGGPPPAIQDTSAFATCP